MDKKSEAKHSSLLETKTCMTSHDSDWIADSLVTDDNTAFNLILDEIESNKIRHLEIITGFAMDKSNKEHLLLNDLLFVMPSIRTWASRPAINKPDVKQKASMAESDIAKLEDTILLSKAKEMKKLIEDNPTIIDPLYVPLARKTLFDQHIVDYEAVVEMPEFMIDQRAVATKNMVDGIAAAMKFRKDTFLDTVKRLRETKPDFFKDFKQSMKVDNNPSRKLSVKGIIIVGGDSQAPLYGKPLANAVLFIPALNKKVKSGEKGIFVLKSIPAGEYTVVFTKFGYEAVTRTIVVNDGERTELSIQMIPKAFPE